MATNTTATATTHTGNGSTNNFAISFSFLANNEVDVTVAGVLKTLDTHYTISGSTVTFTSGNTPANGAAVKFQRDTNISAKKVDFQDGSVLTETDLDTNSDQVLFAQQEITDKLGGIEEGATADQTAAEIRTLVESASDSNVFTDADHSKLNAIEAGATADQTASEIRTLVESASDSNVFTDADHTKLNGIEASATADQTAAEIRTLVESASDSNVFTDADHTKLNGIETGATADQTVSEIKSLIAGSPLDASHLAANSVDSSELVDGSIDTSHLSADCVDGTKIADNAIGSEHLQANSVGTSEIADAELTTLAGMQSGTASKLADSTALTADLADLNQLDGMAKQTTITDDDTKFPTSGAIVDYVAAQLAPIGGLEVIATDAAFPNTQPAAGVVISIADAGGLVVNSSGTSTTARTVGGATVTINNFASNFNSSTVDAGVAIMVSSTGAGNIYNYHKATLKEADLLSLSNDINDFAARYRVTTGEPTSNNDEGDLIYDKNADKMKVFDSTLNAFKEVTSVGDFKFLFLCPAGGSGSPTINGSIATYDLREGSTSGAAASITNAAQLLVSINGVVQKPNTGTSAPSEGFAMVDSNTIIFGSNLPTGAEVFIIQIGSAISLQVPVDNSVATAKIQNQGVTTAKIADDAVTNAKVNASAAISGSKINPNFGSQALTCGSVDSNGGILGASLQLDSSTVNYIYYTDSLQIAKSGHGAELTIDSSGNVGIGTTSPAVKLDVTGKIHASTSIGIRTTSPQQNLHVHQTDSGASVVKFTNSTTTIGSSNGFDIGLDSSEQGFLHVRENKPLLFEINGSERMRIDSSGRLLVGATSTSTDHTLQVQATGNANAIAILGRSSDDIGELSFYENDANTKLGELQYRTTEASFRHRVGGANLLFSTTPSGGSVTERMRITSNGQIMHGCTDVTDSGSSVANNFAFSSDGNPTIVRSHSNMIYGATSNSADRHAMQLVQHRYNRTVFVSVHTNTGITGQHQIFYQGSNVVGGISTSDSATSYSTSSDYRLKENETVISDGITRLKTLIPRRFNWKIDETNTPVDGFFAHEVTAVPEAVTGTKDQVATADDVSNEIKEGDPIYQSIDQSKLVPLITAALQEAIAKIEVLEAKVAALGG